MVSVIKNIGLNDSMFFFFFFKCVQYEFSKISHLGVDAFTTELQREGDAVVICCDDITGIRDGVK